MSRSRILAIALVVAVLVPTWALAQSPVTSPGPGSSPLRDALALRPPDATDLGFTDWSRIRDSLGAQDVTGASPIDDKFAVGMSTVRQEAAASGFGLAYLRRHHDTWGWDTLDVDWEATWSGDGPPVFVVRLRDGTDMEAIAARYDENGFSTEQVGDATVRSHEVDLGADWIGTTELAMANTAFLGDGRTLVMSSSREALEQALMGAGGSPLPGVAGVIDALDGASAAWLILEPACLGYTPLPFDPFDPDPSIGPLPSGEPLHPWTALGVGYERPDWDPVGRIAMGFLEPAHATADAGPRSMEARHGVSQRVSEPYADAVFTLDDSRVEGDTLILDVSPVGDMPRRLISMVLMRDMTFAGC